MVVAAAVLEAEAAMALLRATGGSSGTCVRLEGALSYWTVPR
jgi:hypothetical protein